LKGRTISAVVVRNPRLRWPVEPDLEKYLRGYAVNEVLRRGKYLLLPFKHGTLILHLGMSGSLRLVNAATAPGKHDHLDICLDSGSCLRLTDPRRFGAVLWCQEEPSQHPLLAALGPEPLAEEFTTTYLYQRTRNRKAPIKTFIMDSKVVVGVGNIYANEALYLAGIHPERQAATLSRPRIQRLVAAIRQVLTEAIAAGGTTLRDFVGGDGRPGYFAQQLNVYGRDQQPCPRCTTPLRMTRLGQRATYYCPHCQR